MKKGSTSFLKLAVLAIGAGVGALCIFALPAGIASDNVGYYRPILVGMYVPAIFFFYALYQAWKLLGYIERDQTFSLTSVTMLKRIKFCAVIIGILYMLGMPYIYYAANRDDAPGVVAIGLIIIFASFVVATAAGLFQRLLQSAIDIKSENDLTV